MRHVFSCAVSEVALTINSGFLLASISKAVPNACESIKRRHFQRALKKQEKLEKTMTRPRKTNKHATLLPFQSLSRLRSFPHLCKMYANRIQPHPTASNDIISICSNGNQRFPLFQGCGQGRRPLQCTVLYCIICIVLPCTSLYYFVLRARVHEAHVILQ